MKSLFSFFLFAILNLAVSAQSKIKPVADKLSTHNDSVQYAIGAYLAQWVNTNGLLINNPALFLKGMDDVFRSQGRLLPDSIAEKMVAKYQLTIQMEKGKKAETNLFAGIRDKKDIGLVPGGIYYLILKNGEGVHPIKTDSVVLHIKGTTADGITFENTYLKKKPVTTMISDLIQGVASVLPMMGTGSKWQLYIPSALAYGDKATALIPANSALVVDLELLAVKQGKK